MAIHRLPFTIPLAGPGRRKRRRRRPILYDGYGGVLSNTLPATLTASLGGVPDADTGLVYLGGGRFYDPSLGRPLQPNPAAGPPSVPQALNRYAATAVGAVGVAQAEASNPFATALFSQPEQRIAAAVSQTDPRIIALRDAAAQTTLGYAAGEGIKAASKGSLTIIASKSSWYRTIGHSSRGLRSLFRQPSVAQSQFGKTFRAYTTRVQVQRYWGNGRYVAETGEIIDTAKLPASARVLGPGISPLVRNLAGGSIAFGISAVFQGVEDWNNPYLTSTQKRWRVGIAGTGGLIAWGVGEVAAGAIAGIWAGPIGIGVVTGTTFVWITVIQPFIFETGGLNSERDLAPLQN